MRKTKSHEELNKSNDSIYESSSNTTGFGEISNYGATTSSARTSLFSSYEITPSSTPTKNMSPKMNRKGSRHETLQLNEETNTWKMTPKRQRKKSGFTRGRKQLHTSFIKLQSYLRQENAGEFRFRLIVVSLFLLVFAVILITRYLHYNLQISKSINSQIFVHKNSKMITFLDKKGSNLLHINYGLNIPDDIHPVNCRSFSQQNILCSDWEYRAHLSVKFSREIYKNSFKQQESVTCYTFKWKSYEKYSMIKDCFDMSDSYWFGMGDLYDLKWPLNRMSVPVTPFMTSHRKSDPISGSIIGRTWFLSKGVSISVPLDVPLFISINSTDDPNKVCFISKKQKPYYRNNIHSYFAHLEYSVCLAQNLSTLQNYIFEKKLKNQIDTNKVAGNRVTNSSNISTTVAIPHEHETENIFLDRIIWSTNVNVLPNFTHQTVQSYVDQITNYGLAGIILLDSRWENTIGDLKMNETVFNNPKVLVNILHNKGFKIMLTVSPNIALRSNLVENADEYIFLDKSLNVPLLTRCSSDYDKICALINFTHVDNSEKFKNTLMKNLLSHQVGLSVDGLFFQAIQSSLIPVHYNTDKSINPDQFIEYMNSVIKSLPTSTGISASVNSKDFVGYVTLYSRDSTWEELQNIIPSVLSLGLLGYPLVNTDTVGGMNLFTKLKNETDYINKELYLRWLQLVIFLPVVQFAEPPGGNDLDVIKVAKRLLKLRSEQFLPAMKKSLLEYYEKGSPIIRPMWWTQNEEDAFLIEDQFFVGNDIIVAPIVQEGKTERNVYLPNGWWKDEILAQVIRGGKWMRKYQVPLDKVAFFVRTEPSPPVNK